MINEGSINRPWSAYDGTLTSTAYGQLSLKLDGLVTELNASADIIKLKGNRISIESDNFNLTESGSITANDLTITGGTVNIQNLNTNTFGYINMSGSYISGGGENMYLNDFQAIYSSDSIKLSRKMKDNNDLVISNLSSVIGQYNCQFASLDADDNYIETITVAPAIGMQLSKKVDNRYIVGKSIIATESDSTQTNYDKLESYFTIDYESNTNYIRIVRYGTVLCTIDLNNKIFI